jgi:hypothetical protein
VEHRVKYVEEGTAKEAGSDEATEGTKYSVRDRGRKEE